MTHHIELGKKGEALVAHYLQKQGFSILATNCTTRRGEIDIVAQKGNVLTFVEVKMRTTPYFNISEVITRSKQRKIIHAARAYLLHNGYTSDTMIFRFDAALVQPESTDYSITYIPNAFTAQDY